MAKKQPAPEAVAEQKVAPASNRMIAQINAEGILIGRIVNPSDDDWDTAPPELRFPNGFDNALNRYKLVNWAPDKYRWEPVHHARDAGDENNAPSPDVIAPLARCVVAIVSGAKPSDADLGRLVDFLKTFDGA